MPKRLPLLIFFLPAVIAAQMAGRLAHEQVADTFRRMFNSKNFEGIYQITSSEFKAEIKKTQLMEQLSLELYKPFGRIEMCTYLKKDTSFYAFLLKFADTRMRMNLGVNAAGQIRTLKIEPYAEAAGNKRSNYSSNNTLRTGLDSLIDGTLKSYMQSMENCGISIGISKNDSTYFYHYGETRRGSAQLPDANSLYEIGSITKTFCGLLLAHAIVEKKISLDDDIRDYLPGKYPELTMNKKPILIRHLVTHTSGLPRVPSDLAEQPGYDAQDPYKHYSREMIYEYLKKIKPRTEPGLVFDYSNLGMALLGIILENRYNASFETLVKEKITGPYSLPNTSIQLSAEQQKRLMQGYNDAGDATPYWHLGGFGAAGGLHSSSREMLAYLNYNRLETEPALRLPHSTTFKSERENVAFAWFIKQTKEGNVLYWHNGGTFGFSSFCGFVKEKGISLVVLANSATNVDYIAIAILNYLQQ